jgi:hypothetical protein
MSDSFEQLYFEDWACEWPGQRVATCLHEAGHAIVAADCGVRIHRVFVSSQHPESGTVKYFGAVEHDITTSVEDARIACAGTLAEFVGHASTAVGSMLSEPDLVASMADIGAVTGPKGVAEMRAVVIQTLCILKRRWPAVLRLAFYLLQHDQADTCGVAVAIGEPIPRCPGKIFNLNPRKGTCDDYYI